MAFHQQLGYKITVLSRISLINLQNFIIQRNVTDKMGDLPPIEPSRPLDGPLKKSRSGISVSSPSSMVKRYIATLCCGCVWGRLGYELIRWNGNLLCKKN